MAPFKKYVTCIMAFFTAFNFVTLCQFCPSTLSLFVSFALSLPLCYSLNFTKKLYDWDKRRLFAYMAASAYHVISKEVENRIFRQNWIFRHTCMYKQPTLTKLIVLVEYYDQILDTTVFIKSLRFAVITRAFSKGGQQTIAVFE